MKIVNRGYISVKPLKPFIDWVNKIEDEFYIDENTEPNVYLIDEDFFDAAPVLEANFKKIFRNELIAISEDEENYPEISLVNFNSWFKAEVGSSVFDCDSRGIQTV